MSAESGPSGESLGIQKALTIPCTVLCFGSWLFEVETFGRMMVLAPALLKKLPRQCLGTFPSQRRILVSNQLFTVFHSKQVCNDESANKFTKHH